jgi:two-component system chemotaxis response regulator CheY
MNSPDTKVLKLGAILDLSTAEVFFETMQQRVNAGHELRLDASGVATLTLPCIQIILAATKSNHLISIENPSPAFASAFADLGLDWPRSPETAIEVSPDDGLVRDAVDINIPADNPDDDPTPNQPEDKAMAKRILTIDDSKTIRDMLRMTLVDAGFEVLQAVDGQDGVEVMDRETVDLVITDINMPRMNGYEVVRHLRSNPAHKSLPILVLTTESDTDKKNLAREAGATGWMVKPFDPDKLIATVRKVVP